VRVHQYPKAAGVARDFVGTLVMDALSAVDQRRQIAVQRAVKTLDPVMYMLLEEFGHVEHPVVRTMRDVLVAQERRGAIRRLLDEGMFEAKYGPLPDDFVTRSMTEFANGQVAHRAIVEISTSVTRLRTRWDLCDKSGIRHRHAQEHGSRCRHASHLVDEPTLPEGGRRGCAAQSGLATGT
jgi:hypothetical protein